MTGRHAFITTKTMGVDDDNEKCCCPCPPSSPGYHPCMHDYGKKRKQHTTKQGRKGQAHKTREEQDPQQTQETFETTEATPQKIETMNQAITTSEAMKEGRGRRVVNRTEGREGETRQKGT